MLEAEASMHGSTLFSRSSCWSGRKRATGSAAAKPMGGRHFHKLETERAWLMSRMAEKPDITMRELAAELAERGLNVSHVSVWNLVRRQKQSYKKRRARK